MLLKKNKEKDCFQHNQNQDFLVIKTVGQQIKRPTKVLLSHNLNMYKPRQTYSAKSVGLQRPTQNNQSISRRESQKENDESRKSFHQIQGITSRCWIICEMGINSILHGKDTNKKIEVASLTKIVNLYTILQILEQNNLCPSLIEVVMSEAACNIGGTSAQLKNKDVIKLSDLFYGMMLPSGNDAAYQIALLGGAILKLSKSNETKIVYSRLKLQVLMQCKSNISRFLEHMNKLCLQLGMLKSKWANPHGLSNRDNKTTLKDMSIICNKIMQNKLARSIVSTINHECVVESYHLGIDSRIVKWTNTNKMLEKGWNGLKTGVTPNAGPCLAATYQKDGKEFLVMVAGCDSMEKRWNQVERIRDLVD